MTNDEMNRKISEIRDEWYFYDYDGSREPKNWLFSHNAMTLLKEMPDYCYLVKMSDDKWSCGNYDDSLCDTPEAAICQVWLKWKEAK